MMSEVSFLVNASTILRWEKKYKNGTLFKKEKIQKKKKICTEDQKLIIEAVENNRTLSAKEI